MITGSSRGLGYALADHFLGFGDDVIISSRNMSACEHAAVQLGEKHPLRKVFPFACDVRNAGKTLRARSCDCSTGSYRQPEPLDAAPRYHQQSPQNAPLLWHGQVAGEACTVMQPHLHSHTAGMAVRLSATATSAQGSLQVAIACRV